MMETYLYLIKVICRIRKNTVNMECYLERLNVVR